MLHNSQRLARRAPAHHSAINAPATGKGTATFQSVRSIGVRCGANRQESVAVGTADSARHAAEHAPLVSEVQEISGSIVEHYRRDDAGRWVANTRDRDSSSTAITERIKGTLLPDGYPASVTPDYLSYQLWAFPTHVAGWVANSLVTSTLLKAVGIGASPTAAAAAGAAIKWITKDGIGALGRFLVGGSLGRYFDEDPRFWRMVAATIAIVGASLEIVTAATPSAFVVLATSGNFAKAVGKGISRPSFRVIQNHFAAGNNVGDVAAKEEIWEVCGQLAGLALSVAILTALSNGDDPSGTHVITCWISAQAANVILRYKSLSMLQLHWLNQASASELALHYVDGKQLPDVQAICSSQPLLLPKQFLKPAVFMNASVKQLTDAASYLQIAQHLSGRQIEEDGTVTQQSNDGNGANSKEAGFKGKDVGKSYKPTAASSAQSVETSERASSSNGSEPLTPSTSGDGTGDHFTALLSMYTGEAYVLAAGPHMHKAEPKGFLHRLGMSQQIFVGIKKGAQPADLLQAMMQAAWLHTTVERRLDEAGEDGLTLHQLNACLLESLQYARAQRAGFLEALARAGWNVSDVRMRSRHTCILKVS